MNEDKYGNEYEVEYLESTRGEIESNMLLFERELKESKQLNEELFKQYQSGDMEVYDRLAVSFNLVETYGNSLKKNKAAYNKPYFGRVCYKDLDYDKFESVYVGKSGITKNQIDVLVADWRAPISTVYYDNELGRGKYKVPDGKEIEIDLNLKRTYDIEEGRLNGYYDSDVATNDELLVKYLSKNKEVVLSDIISTIQKEQNAIIRESPYSNVLVQGVAGSGKTTVALHKISYILYNYEHKYKPSEFCIVGGSDMLLNYITSGLPELDVYNIGQMRMDKLVCQMIGSEWKSKFKLVPLYDRIPWRSKLKYIKELEKYLEKILQKIIPIKSIEDKEIGVILTAESIKEICDRNKDMSLKYKVTQLNKRILSRVDLQVAKLDGDKEFKKRKHSEYKGYFSVEKDMLSVHGVYMDFLTKYISENGLMLDDDIIKISKGNFDVYDVASIALLTKRLVSDDMQDLYSQVFIDEAQDFGAMIYYVLRQVLPKCIFTVMGDISQNVNYETGMNSWEELKESILIGEKDKFYLLSKSYRNTIEISTYASKILELASEGAYKIEPVIRHGREVEFVKAKKDKYIDKIIEIINGMKNRELGSIAVVCGDDDSANLLRNELSKVTKIAESTENFENGVMVLPVKLTKGLEFDAVILFNIMQDYESQLVVDRAKAKLLYVAMTRALHELVVVSVI